MCKKKTCNSFPQISQQKRFIIQRSKYSASHTYFRHNNLRHRMEVLPMAFKRIPRRESGRTDIAHVSLPSCTFVPFQMLLQLYLVLETFIALFASDTRYVVVVYLVDLKIFQNIVTDLAFIAPIFKFICVLYSMGVQVHFTRKQLLANFALIVGILFSRTLCVVDLVTLYCFVVFPALFARPPGDTAIGFFSRFFRNFLLNV